MKPSYSSRASSRSRWRWNDPVTKRRVDSLREASGPRTCQVVESRSPSMTCRSSSCSTLVCSAMSWRSTRRPPPKRWPRRAGAARTGKPAAPLAIFRLASLPDQPKVTQPCRFCKRQGGLLFVGRKGAERLRLLARVVWPSTEKPRVAQVWGSGRREDLLRAALLLRLLLTASLLVFQGVGKLTKRR